MSKNGLNDDSATRKALPEDDPVHSGVVREVRAWAREGEAIPQLDIARLRAEVEASKPGRKRRLRSLWSGAGWFLAAASLCFLAASLGDFQVQWGSFVIQMGKGESGQEVEALRTQMADVQRRFELNRSEYSAAIETLSNRTIALENDLHATAARLIRAQEAESATRYSDISSILSMTSRNE